MGKNQTGGEEMNKIQEKLDINKYKDPQYVKVTIDEAKLRAGLQRVNSMNQSDLFTEELPQ
jgi:hypothetical protein